MPIANRVMSKDVATMRQIFPFSTFWRINHWFWTGPKRGAVRGREHCGWVLVL